MTPSAYEKPLLILIAVGFGIAGGILSIVACLWIERAFRWLTARLGW